MRALLVTGHTLHSSRRAGFHHIAAALHQDGWQVVFLTAGLSWLSVLRRDARLTRPVRRQANRLIKSPDGPASFVWFSRWHPANLRVGLLNRWSYRLFARYGELLPPAARELVADADLVIFESTPGLLLFDRCRAIQPAARTVYRVSDDLRMLRNHPAVIACEERIAAEFDLVSTPSEFLHRRFAKLPRARLMHHGIHKELFDADCSNPYPRDGRVHCVYVGASHFDFDFVARASAALPEAAFHIIGPIRPLPRRANVISYGELPFAETIPYLKHADLGLATRSYAPGAESLTDSLKIIQYTYCRLPIVAPEFLRCPRSHVYYYAPGRCETMVSAVRAALGHDRATIDRSGIRSWRELARDLAGPCPGTVSPPGAATPPG